MQVDAATANYDLAILADFRATRFQQSIENNPLLLQRPILRGSRAARYIYLHLPLHGQQVRRAPRRNPQPRRLEVLLLHHPASPAPSSGPRATSASPRTGTSAPSVMSTPYLSSSPTSSPQQKSTLNSSTSEETPVKPIHSLVSISRT
jgi:hypothetical protein